MKIGDFGMARLVGELFQMLDSACPIDLPALAPAQRPPCPLAPFPPPPASCSPGRGLERAALAAAADPRRGGHDPVLGARADE